MCALHTEIFSHHTHNSTLLGMYLLCFHATKNARFHHKIGFCANNMLVLMIFGLEFIGRHVTVGAETEVGGANCCFLINSFLQWCQQVNIDVADVTVEGTDRYDMCSDVGSDCDIAVKFTVTSRARYQTIVRYCDFVEKQPVSAAIR